MGCRASSSRSGIGEAKVSPLKSPVKVNVQQNPLGDGTRTTRWKIQQTMEQAREKYEKDGTLSKTSDEDHLKLRQLLEEPVGQNFIGAFAKELQSQELFMFWIDVQEFKGIPSDNYRRSKGLHIYNKYIKTGAVLQLGYIDEKDDDWYGSILEKSKEDAKLITIDFFDKIQLKCFTEMYRNVYTRFKTSPKFVEMEREVKKSYNKVGMDDFDYFGKLGEGGFALVVHCRKRSTGKHYAMKIQKKVNLLETFADDPSRVTYEKIAFIRCQHPFIVSLDYAFQNDALVVMVLGLATAGDLLHALKSSPDGRLSEDRVQFYVAEIVLALAHLHEMGLMYRDLKPNNVLLHSDGHIQLADFGGVVDSNGKALGSTDYSPLFASTFEEPPTLQRRTSIMGTFGYMAPEMVVLMNQTNKEPSGYTSAVDWWGLGATMYKMLTGSKPFEVEEAISSFFELKTSFFNPSKNTYADEYVNLFADIAIPPYMSAAAADCVRRFLHVNENQRMGAGKDGIKNIKSHAFFEGIDWEKLEQKHHLPPFVPKTTKLKERPQYQSFETMMESLHKSEWMDDFPSLEQNKHFQSWDYICNSTLKVEFGISNEMEQYDSNFKIRRLLG